MLFYFGLLKVSRIKRIRHHSGFLARLTCPCYRREMQFRHEEMGARLEQARQTAGYSRRGLSEQAGLANQTAFMIETGRRMPGVDTVERLSNVLGVSPAWIAYGSQPVRRIKNFLTAPGYDPLKLGLEQAELLHGCGGTIDQSMLYLDPYGAAQYATIAETYKGLPLKKAAQQISKCKEPLSVIALGAGLARHETRLVEHLLKQPAFAASDEPSLDLFLVDLSQPLLSVGYRHACESLDRFAVPISAIEGDFRKLPSFMDYFETRGPRRNLVTMLGYTIGNFSNEVAFLRDSLVGLRRGDLLLLDFGVRADDPAAIDPILSGNIPDRVQRSALFAFLLNPVTRVYGFDAKIDVVPTLSTSSCAVPESYAVELHATVQTRTGSKTFIAASWKRYDPHKFAGALKSVGWELVESWDFDEDRPSILALFRRS